MARHLMIAALLGALCIAAPAHAQQDTPELDGAPPPLRVPAPAPPKPKPQPPKPAPKPAAPASTTTSAALKAEEARLARQAEAQKAEAARLAAEAESLKAEQARLEARATAIAAEEKRLAQLRTDQEADYRRQLAELQDQRATPPEPAAEPPPPAPTRPIRVRVTYDDARRACSRAGVSRAVDLDFSYARYENAPHWFERERELRGLMRMDDRRGYMLVDTVCTLDASGAVEHFELLR